MFLHLLAGLVRALVKVGQHLRDISRLLIPHRKQGQVRAATRRSPSTGARLNVFAFEGRVVPSSTPFDLQHDGAPVEAFAPCSDGTSLDYLVRLTPWTPAGQTQWSESDYNDVPDDSSASLGVAFVAMLLTPAALVPYDREEDAAELAVLHGVQVS